MTNTISKRAQAVLTGGYGTFKYDKYPNCPLALIAVLQFASQNPGLDFRNYGNVTAYRSDSRRITKAWHDVKAAVDNCHYAGVTDADILMAAEGAFSGRLSVEFKDNAYRVDYCVGQYFPTEYRNAAAAVLEYAARIATRRSQEVTA